MIGGRARLGGRGCMFGALVQASRSRVAILATFPTLERVPAGG